MVICLGLVSIQRCPWILTVLTFHLASNYEYLSGWWFGTMKFFWLSIIILGNSSSQLTFTHILQRRSTSTTNQLWMLWSAKVSIPPSQDHGKLTELIGILGLLPGRAPRKGFYFWPSRSVDLPCLEDAKADGWYTLNMCPLDGGHRKWPFGKVSELRLSTRDGSGSLPGQ